MPVSFPLVLRQRVAGYCEGYATFWNANVMVELSNGAFDIRVWEPGDDFINEPDTLYEWLQSKEHFDTTPEGAVFVFLHKDEYNPVADVINEAAIVYEDDSYIALGYESYTAMKTDFAN